MSKQIDFLKRCIALKLQSGGLLDLLDLIERLQSERDQLRAELAMAKADIARLKREDSRVKRVQNNSLKLANKVLSTKLAVEQAKNVRLLDFIARAPVSSGVCCCGETMDGHSSPMFCGHSPVDMWDHAVRELLDAPSDTSALEAIVKKAGEVMRERSINVAWNNEPDCNGPIEMEIHALPGVTLEDLK